MTNKGLDMSIKEDQERCRSLVCDPNGIIVAEMVYRCMICFYVSDTMSEARQHYVLKHIEEDDITNDNCTDNIDDIDDMCQNNIPKHLNKKSNKFQNGNRNDNGIENFSSNNKYRNGSDTPIDMSPNSDSFERYLPLVTITEGLETNSNNNIQNGGKSGYVNCAVCGITRYYSCVQRRYGQYTCVPCYRNFKLFFDKPERYSCPNLGKCSLSTRTRCKACWMKACIDVFQVDVEKRQTIEAYTPIKRNVNINNSEDEHLDGLENLESSSPIDDKLDHSDDNNNTISNNNLHSSKEALSMMFAFNNGTDLPALFSKSSLNNFGLLASSTNNNFFGNLNDNNNNSIINHNNNASNTNLNNNLLTNALSNESLFVSQKRTHPSNKNVNGNLSTNNSVKNQDAKETNSKPAKQTKPTSGKKIWSCGKCVTCLAEDCNKCVYCLDRPKNGGPFIKKQRCVKRRCLLKLKNKGKTVNNPAYVY